ncbi:MAG: Glyoxalase/Bleomycin resistance protein/Dioxygenase superfamily, partial [Chloroflexi bacterium]|nr:Glyoxalase/Bleomycin resistance protein/Dioxygenase superfamily [Chloroflexota bacterium]
MTTLDHVGVRVTDLDVAVKFYSELLGLEMLERRTRIDPHEGEVEAAAMKVNDGAWIFLLRTPKVQSHVESIEGRPEHFCLVFEPDEFARVIDRL